MNSKKPFFQRAFHTVFAVLLIGSGITQSANAGGEITQGQAVARVRRILDNNSGPCRITQTQSISAARVKAGWRVTARIRMSASGVSRAETAVWIVSSTNGATAQDQLTAEIALGCP